MDWQGSQGVLTSWSTEHHVGNGSHAIYPFPLGDLLSRRHGTIHVVLPLHCDGVLLTLMVGSNVVHLNHGTWERRPSAANVEGGFVEVCFFHTCMMAQIPEFGRSRWYKTAEENLKVACANRAGGRAADWFVSLTARSLSVNNRCRRWCTYPHQTFLLRWHQRFLPESHWSQRKDQCRKWSRPSVNFSTVTTIHDFCANGKCLCHYNYWHTFLTFNSISNCWHISTHRLVTFKNARIYDIKKRGAECH